MKGVKIKNCMSLAIYQSQPLHANSGPKSSYNVEIINKWCHHTFWHAVFVFHSSSALNCGPMFN